VPLHLHAEALRSADVDVVLRQIHAVASFVRAERFDGREDRGHSRLVLDLLEQLLADQKRFEVGPSAQNGTRSIVGVVVESLALD
jgi:hypothetical protein